MNRRQFVASLFGAAAGTVLADSVDWERLLWEPGKRLFLDLWTPEPEIIITPTWVTKEMSLQLFLNELTLLKNFDRTYDEQFQGTTIGTTVNVRLPQRWR